MDVLLFGDPTVDFAYLRKILSAREHTTLLTSFLKHATVLLRIDISNLPQLQRQRIPPLNDLLEFIGRYQKVGFRSAAVENTLLSISQFSHWIGLSEECPNLLLNETSIIGLGTGLLAASAVSCISSKSFLIPVAVEVVRIAFRLGLHIDSVVDNLQPQDQDTESWSVVVSDVTEIVAKEVVNDFNEQNAISYPNHVYISGISPSGITVSGPPRTLKKLLENPGHFNNGQILETRIFGPYHAPHLHCEGIIQELLNTEADAEAMWADLVPVVPIFSASKGKTYSASSFRQLLEQCMRDILIDCPNISLMLHECSEAIIAAKGHSRLVPIGPTDASASIISTIKSDPSVSISLLDWELFQEDPGRRGPGNLRASKIAIVGMSGRFPGASDVDKFWEILQQGRDMHKEVPSDRFDAKAHFDPSGKGKNMSHTPFGCFLENAGLFDPRFFNMSPREATQTDPMQRLALITAFEALEMSGYVPNRTPSTKLDRIGTFYGQTSDDWREINEAQDIDTYFITGGVRAFGPGRINYHFKFSGPSFSVDTACSSSMAAIQLACTSLWAGDCDTAVAGGVNIMTNPDIFSGLSKGQFLSKVGPCQTFDNNADGYCRGDGVGTVILKRLEDAEADNDNVLALILATATNHSADAVSITHPHDKTQERLYKKVLDQAGVDAVDVGYVEMHGTGTQAGDGTEMRSVTNVFAPVDHKREPHQKLYLGSVKANVGHGEAVSGVTALIKSLLILKKNAIPPHVGIKTEINKGFPKDLVERNVHIAFQETPFTKSDGKRRVFVNNFSAAGGNTAVLLEDGPTRQPHGTDPRSTHVVSISARALSSLKDNIRNLITYLEKNPEVSLPNLGYTTTARKIHHNYRISFPVADIQKLKAALTKAVESDVQPKSSPPKVAFTFTGQGSHYAGIGAELFNTSAQFRADLIDLDNIATSLGFISFIPLVDGSIQDIGTFSPQLVQVGLTCIQMALTRLWASWGVKPSVVVGHSLGEYAALNAAGVLSASDTIYLVGERARLLESMCFANTHAMLAVKTDVLTLKGILKDEPVEIACVNGPEETVLSGTVSDISSIQSNLEGRRLKNTKLDVPYAFHSAQVDIIRPDFERIAASVIFNPPTTPFLSPLLSTAQTEGLIDAKYLGRHAREAVNYLGALRAGQDSGLVENDTVFIEIGPHPVTSSFVKATLGSSHVTGPSLKKKESAWETLATTASLVHNNGVDVDWNEYHRDFADSHEMLELPAYAWALKNYWIQYVNDWCLTKGDAPVARPAAKPTLSTTSVHRVIKESYADGKGHLSAESELERPDLWACVCGHSVNGANLVPSSLYGDIGVTVGQYMFREMHDLPASASTPGVSVRDMEVSETLIAKKGDNRVLKITATADLSTNCIDVTLSTGTTQHAKFVAEYGEPSKWEAEWKRSSHLVASRIFALDKEAAEGHTHTLLRGMAYKLFSSLVDYEDTYRGMERVILNSRNLEATAHVVCQPLKEGQSFDCAPYWIDSVGHLAGFIMNGNDQIDPKCVYVSHGWESMRFSRPIEPGKHYRTYVRMMSLEPKIVGGDVYMFDGDDIVGMIGGLKFQELPRNVLEMILPPAGGTKRASPAPPQVQVSAHETKIKKTPVATEKVEKKVAVTTTGSIVSQVLAIIAEECGVDHSELADGNSFADLGVDSLMQLAISGRMRETLELEVSSTLFTEHPTVGKLRNYLATLKSPEPTASSPVDDFSDNTSSTLSDCGCDNDQTRQGSPTTPSTPPTGDDVYPHDDKISRAIETMATKGITINTADNTAKVSSQVSVQEVDCPCPDQPCDRVAHSFVLQGNPKTASHYFFVIPDGGGSATSYMSIPNLSKHVCVFGLNSPFMKTPHEYTCGVCGIAVKFVAEIQRRQPKGPYWVGGWSAGGVIAFEVTQQLIKSGQVVERLILIDSPCPLTIEPLPPNLHRWFNSIGLLGDGDDGKVPPWLLPHFAASIQALSSYNARRIDPRKAPKTYAIWCEDGVCKCPTDPRPDPYPYGHAQFLLENKTDFGPALWDVMVGKENVICSRVRGNHFTMMKAPHVHQLADEIRKALDCDPRTCT